MNIMLKNGTLLSNVTAEELKRMQELGLVDINASSGIASNVVTEEVHAGAKAKTLLG